MNMHDGNLAVESHPRSEIGKGSHTPAEPDDGSPESSCDREADGATSRVSESRARGRSQTEKRAASRIDDEAAAVPPRVETSTCHGSFSSASSTAPLLSVGEAYGVGVVAEQEQWSRKVLVLGVQQGRWISPGRTNGLVPPCSCSST